MTAAMTVVTVAFALALGHVVEAIRDGHHNRISERHPNG
jgi:hypothetical protein